MTDQLVEFMWQIARPDSRQYRQNSAELYPQQFVIGVNVPLTKEYVLNAEALIQFDLGSGNATRPTPIYTPFAVRYCLDKLGEHLVDTQTSKVETGDETWDDEKPEKPAKSSDDEEWDKAIDTDEKWDDTEEDWKD